MSAEAIGWIIAAVILIGVILFLFKGMIQTFRRNRISVLPPSFPAENPATKAAVIAAASISSDI